MQCNEMKKRERRVEEGRREEIERERERELHSSDIATISLGSLVFPCLYSRLIPQALPRGPYSIP